MALYGVFCKGGIMRPLRSNPPGSLAKGPKPLHWKQFQMNGCKVNPFAAMRLAASMEV